MKEKKNLNGISEPLREKHYAFSLCSVCTWKNRSKSRACAFQALLILCHQPFILQTASSSRVGSQQHSPMCTATVCTTRSRVYPSTWPHFTHPDAKPAGSHWSLSSDFSWGWTRWSRGCRSPAVKSMFYSTVFPHSQDAHKFQGEHLNYISILLISAVNYRTAANKSSLGYDGT